MITKQMKQKKKKAINFQTRLVARISEDEHKKITDYASANNTTISILIRNYINTLSK